jgi:hypothetical protein
MRELKLCPSALCGLCYSRICQHHHSGLHRAGAKDIGPLLLCNNDTLIVLAADPPASD